MSQAAGAEPLEHVGRLVRVVADDQTPGQRRVVVGQHVRRFGDELAYAVRCHGERPPVPTVAEALRDELPDDVLPRDSVDTIRIERRSLAEHPDDVAALPPVDTKATRAAADPQLEAFAVDLEDHTRRRPGRSWVVDERGPPRERPEPIGGDVDAGIDRSQRRARARAR